MTKSHPRRRWLSYSLRGLLLAITAFALWLGWWVNSAQEQRAAVLAMRQCDAHANISYDNDSHSSPYSSLAASTGTVTKRGSRVPTFLETRLGNDFFHNVVSASFGDVWTDPARKAADNQVFQKVSRLHHLDQLVVNFAADDADVAHIARAKSLKLLWFSKDCPDLTDDALRSLARSSRIEKLMIANARITDTGLAHVGKMTQLKCLALGKLDPFFHPVNGFDITDEGLAHLAGLSNLMELQLKAPKVTGRVLRHAASLPRLAHLQLDCRGITDDDLQFLAAATNLESLEMVGTNIDGTGFKHLAPLSNLKWLTLDGPNIGDEAVGYLARLPNLFSVNLYHTRVSAAGLEHFTTAPSLRQIGLIPAVEGDTVALKKALPKTSVLNGGRAL